MSKNEGGACCQNNLPKEGEAVLSKDFMSSEEISAEILWDFGHFCLPLRLEQMHKTQRISRRIFFRQAASKILEIRKIFCDFFLALQKMFGKLFSYLL